MRRAVTRRTPAASATYVYGLAAGRTPPRLRARLAGLPGTGPLRTIAVEPGLWLVAADAPLARYDGPVIEAKLRDLDWVSVCALAHEAVVEEAARRASLIPMKLFTLFSSDDRAVAHVRRRRRSLARVLERIAGSQEWGLRVTAAPARGAGGASRVTPVGPGAGRRFLLMKKRQRDAARGPAAGRGAVRRLLRAVAREAAACREQPLVVGAPVVLDAALLVRRARTARFRRAVRSMAAALAPRGYSLALTGPWPAYNFVAARA